MKLATRNDITGDSLVSKDNSDLYRSGWDRIFAKEEKIQEHEPKDLEEDQKECEP